MLSKTKTRRRAIVALIASFFVTAARTEPTKAQDPAALTTAGVNYHVTRSVDTLQMIERSSRILTLDKPIPRFQVQNEQILTANPINKNQIQISALTAGITQLNMWDSEDNLYTVDVVVSADAREVEAILATQFPGSNLKVTALSKGAVLSGTVNNVDDVDRAVQIVETFYANVVTNVRVVGVQQIMLHTKIMEVSRTKFRELGVDWALSDRTNATGVLFGAGGMIDAPASNFAGIAPVTLQSNTRLAADIGRYDLDVLVKALRQNDLVKVLAEPTVVATHGRPSRFIVGGQVPYIVPTGNGSISIQYEEFGTAVDFLPFVVGPGRVRLEVRPEVSEPDPARAIVLQGATIPAFRQRYVETAVEMNAGQTFAIAGLLQNRVESTKKATPFFGELPYVGTLFRRVAEQNNEIELLITVTPELAEAMDPHQVPMGGPGLNTDVPTDKEFFLRGYMEVPRTDCGVSEGGLIEGQCLPEGQYIPAAGVAPHGLPHEVGSGGIESVQSSPSYVTGQVVPTSRPTPIGPGVTLVSPQQ